MTRAPEPHWTDVHFAELAKQGFKYGWLAHGGQPYTSGYHNKENFKGANTLEEIAKLAGKLDHCFPPAVQIFYGLSPADGVGGMPPHHHYMAFIFPKEGTDSRSQWWVLGYVVELWRYKD
jgi:hypothetical protein